MKRIVLHELIITDSNYKEHIVRFFNIGLTHFTDFLRMNVAARSPLSAATACTLDPFDARITVNAGTYVIADARTNSLADEAAAFTSKARAEDHLRQAAIQDPQVRDTMHVIPASELQVTV